MLIRGAHVLSARAILALRLLGYRVEEAMADTVKVALALFGLTALAPAEFLLEHLARAPETRQSGSRFALHRNSDLKREGARMADRLREMAARGRRNDIESLAARSAEAIDRSAFAAEYASALRADAVQLRDEILARLPRARRAGAPHLALEVAGSPDGLETAADALEQLARLLPSMRYWEPEATIPEPQPDPRPLWAV
jgi:hypothetical protein